MQDDDEKFYDDAPAEDNEGLDASTNGRRRISSDKKDPEIHSLHDRHKRKRLIVQADFQRQFVWDKIRASRLIESAIMGVPLPIVYLSQESDDKEYVIDGQQRLTSFFSFIDGKLPDGSEFKLSGLKVLKEHNGQRFSDLPEAIQDKIQAYSLRTVTFDKDSDADLKYDIFARLNMGSVSLNDQELRNCIYRGEYNNLLRELSEDKEFMSLMRYTGPDKRMKDVEYVLRFAAFYHKPYYHYSGGMKKFLNQEMERYKNISEEDAHDLRRAFKNSVHIIGSLLGENAFKRFYRGKSEKEKDGDWKSGINAALYDVLMQSFAKEDRNIVQPHLDAIREALIYLMTSDDEFIDSIEKWTSSSKAIEARFDIWRLTLKEIIGVRQKEKRCFSHQLKQELFDNDQTCQICGQRISRIDDAAVDHIKQYWQGGKTIPENARLTHRFCNWSRARKE